MRLITDMAPVGTGLSVELAKAVSEAFDDTAYFPWNGRKVMSKAGLSRETQERFIDFWLKRHAKGMDIGLMQPVLVKCAESAKSVIAIELMSEMSNFTREAFREHAYYKMPIFDYYFYRMEAQMKSYSRAEKIITLSGYAKGTFEKAGYDNVSSIGCMGINTNAFKPSLPPEEFSAVMISAFTPMKGVRYLVEAWKAKPFPLKLVGNMPPEMRKTIPEGISLKGFSNNTLPHYQSASCLVFPTLSDAFGKVITEAMACGLPVITTPNSGGPEMIKDGKNGFIIPIRDSKAIRKAVQYLQDNPSEAVMMGKNARKSAEKSTWNAVTRAIKKELN